MEPTIQKQPQSFNPIGTPAAAAYSASDGGQTVVGKVSNAAQAVREQCEKAVDYGRENPGKTTLIALGVGVGVGVLLVGSFGGSRSRRSRLVEPVMGAVSSLARELFR